jgi:hypothetical protein
VPVREARQARGAPASPASAREAASLEKGEGGARESEGGALLSLLGHGEGGSAARGRPRQAEGAAARGVRARRRKLLAAPHKGGGAAPAPAARGVRARRRKLLAALGVGVNLAREAVTGTRATAPRTTSNKQARLETAQGRTK